VTLPVCGAGKGRRTAGRITGRLRVRDKLNVLVLLPLAAVLLVAVPFVTGEVRSARSAATTAAAASDARRLGGLIWQLQRERLLTAGYIVSPHDDGVGLKRQHKVVTDATADLLRRLGPAASDELVASLTRIGSLNELRAGALARGASLDSVARAYHAVVQAMIEALRLVPQRTSDSEGTRQLTALDALLRANEESALRGMALIVAASDPRAGAQLLQNAALRSEQLIERFVEQSDVAQAGQVVNVEQGDAARRVDAIAKRLTGTRQRDVIGFAADALAAVDAQSTLRRVVQDRVTGEIADAATGRAAAARITAWAVGIGTALVFLLVTVLTLTVSRSIAVPLRRLTDAALNLANVARAELVRVSDEENLGAQQSPQLPAIDLASKDEIGELAVAFNRVQATAAELVERQLVSRRNVSLMFINIAQRTRNLVGRQLAAVDDLERNEQNPTVLAGLYRLDHLATRLRRNAENLLVLAGSRVEARIKRPTPLSTIIRGALTEIEEYDRVHLDMKCEVTVTPDAAADLVLIFAELLENATTFSPPESAVRVRAELDQDGCRVLVIDQGIGMKPQRLEEENRRLIERERLDIAPTRVLGLFVVGRLTRRHGFTVELTASPDGGTTAMVWVPATLFRVGSAGEPTEPVETIRATAAVPLPPAVSAALARSADGFSWFLAKRHAAELPPGRDPDVEGARMQHQAAIGRAAPSAVAAVPSQPSGGARAVVATAHGASPLTRRVPGANLAPGLREQPPTSLTTHQEGWRTRDPDAERKAFDSFTSAWAQAAAQTRNDPAATARQDETTMERWL
jgi:signal transduction histidine kinase